MKNAIIGAAGTALAAGVVGLLVQKQPLPQTAAPPPAHARAAKSLPAPPPLPAVLPPPDPRCVAWHYDPKERLHNAFDVFYITYTNLLTNHTYRPEWSLDLSNWTGLPRTSLTWIEWDAVTAALHNDQLQLGFPVRGDDLAQKFFRLHDVTDLP